MTHQSGLRKPPQCSFVFPLPSGACHARRKTTIRSQPVHGKHLSNRLLSAVVCMNYYHPLSKKKCFSIALGHTLVVLEMH